MIHPDYARLQEESIHIADDTRQDGYTLNLSVNRASAILDAAYLYETMNGLARYCIPNNGNFSDAECELWELFLNAIRTGKQIAKDG